MTHIDTLCFSRRDLLKGGGALVILVDASWMAFITRG